MSRAKTMGMMKNIILVVLMISQFGAASYASEKRANQEAIMPAPPTIAVDIRQEKSPYFELRTSKAVWGKIFEPLNTEGIGYLGPLLYPLVGIVLAIDCVVGVVTVPYDILASPFRQRYYKSVTYWKVSGRVTDKAGNGVPSFPIKVHVSVMPPEQNMSHNGGQTFDTTDKDGNFTTSVSGVGAESPEDRIDVTISVGHESSYTRYLARVGTNAVKPTAPEDYIWSEYGDPRDPKVYLEKFARIKPKLETTKDPQEFISYAKKIDSRYPPECLDPVIDRFNEFYYVDTRDIGDKTFANPQAIFHEQSQVIAYMKTRDGHRLKVALGILKRMFLLDRDREAIREILYSKYLSAAPEIRKEMIGLALLSDEKSKSGTIAFLEKLLKIESNKELATEIETGLEGLRAPKVSNEQRKWKYMEPAVDKRHGCVSFPYGTRTFTSNDYRGIKEIVVTGNTGVVYSKKYEPSRESVMEKVSGIKPGKYIYAAINGEGGRDEYCFEVIGLNASPKISAVQESEEMLNFDLNLNASTQNGLAKAELFDADMSGRTFTLDGTPKLHMSLRREQLPYSYLLQLTDKSGITVQKEIIVRQDNDNGISLWEGENGFSAAVGKGNDVKVNIGPWLTARFNKVTEAGNIAVTLSKIDWNLGGKVMVLPRGIELSGGSLLSFDKAILTFKFNPKSFSQEQLKRISVHQLNSEQEYPTTSNMLPAKLDLQKDCVTVETSRLGRYVLLVPGYKKLHVLKSKKMIRGKPEAEVVSPLDIELIEAPMVTADRIYDIPAGAKLISQAYGFKPKSKDFSAPTDIILRFDPKTKPCPEKERPNLKLIHFGLPNYGYPPETAGNDALGERYGELSNIDQLGFLVALACMQ